MGERTTQKVGNVLGRVALGAAAAALALSYAPIGFAQADSRPSGSDQARQAQMKDLKAKIDNLEGQLHKLQSHGAVVASDTKRDANKNPSDGGQMAQAGGSGSEHPMGGEMGGMGGTNASPAASPGGETAASPGAMPMDEHMKGMEHMHGMMHGRDGGANPAASPGGMPMEHAMPMEHPMGGMGGGGMQGGAGRGTPSRRPARVQEWAAG